MDKSHLANIQNALDASVAEGIQAGVNCLVWKDGQEQGYWESGFRDVEGKVPFSRDTIVRCYSMSKPITGVAAMTLLEKGKIDLYDEVSTYLPAFKDMTCMKNGKVEKAWRPLIIQDLLNMTSGISYGGDNDEAHQHISKLIYCDGGLNQSAAGPNNITTRQVADRIAEGPLSFEPGTDYEYGMSADVLGAVIEVVTGMKFSEYLKKTIWDPLEMKDTGFYVPSEKQDRLSKVYRSSQGQAVGAWGGNSKGGKVELFTNCNLGIQADMTKDPAFESGGAGMVSTVDDYMRFVQMLCNKGILDGKRILKEETVKYMSQARLRPNLQALFDMKMEHWSGYSYANLNRVCIEPGTARAITVKGEFGWDGWLGTYMSVDIINNLAICYMTQKVDAGTTCVTRKMKNIVYTSL
ncbi:MAG: beta-lactamase family protein [Treponema sp.]|nr:beta-lactamase family protein [Treponema sp.]